MPSVKEVLESEDSPDLLLLRLKNPDNFIAGGLHENLREWEEILTDHPMKERILKWLRHGVDVEEFSQHFCGRFKKQHYDSERPPRKIFPNHQSCKKHETFVSSEILKRVTTGALLVWGKVEDGNPPHLVLPLTGEPSKLRLCIDGRFLNLWMQDRPHFTTVSLYVYKNSFMTKCDKSGYDHIRLTESSRSYLGFSGGVGILYVQLSLSAGKNRLLFTIVLGWLCRVT